MVVARREDEAIDGEFQDGPVLVMAIRVSDPSVEQQITGEQVASIREFGSRLGSRRQSYATGGENAENAVDSMIGDVVKIAAWIFGINLDEQAVAMNQRFGFALRDDIASDDASFPIALGEFHGSVW